MNEDSALMWLAYFGGAPARELEKLIRRQRTEIDRLRAGIPEGVTPEEWEILAELRNAVTGPRRGGTVSEIGGKRR